MLLIVAIGLLVGGGDWLGGDGEDETGPGPAVGESARAEVLRVVDGDTIEVSVDGQVQDVRYIGVDTVW